MFTLIPLFLYLAEMSLQTENLNLIHCLRSTELATFVRLSDSNATANAKPFSLSLPIAYRDLVKNGSFIVFDLKFIVRMIFMIIQILKS